MLVFVLLMDKDNVPLIRKRRGAFAHHEHHSFDSASAQHDSDEMGAI